MEKRIFAENKYMWIPVRKDGNPVKLEWYVENEKVMEMDVPLTDGKPDYWAVFDVETWENQWMTVRDAEGNCDMNEEYCQIINEEKIPPCPKGERPKLHYAPETGWMNDPNGLIYVNGVWKIYHQYNPYGCKWGNMHWGATETRDFIHWKETSVVLSPDESGVMFSGCGLLAESDGEMWKKGDILYYYTAAGSVNKWSDGQQYTQRLAVSSDEGYHLDKKDVIVLPTVEAENRDPKVFWHEETQTYVMILYIKDYIYHIYRSKDGIQWEKTQELTGDGMWECPDLFQIRDDKTGESMWVFWSAQGYYYLGTFDGYHFEKKSEMMKAYAMPENPEEQGRAYAAQTFSDTKGRVVQLAWLHMPDRGRCWNGQLSLPVELELSNGEQGKRMVMKPARELENLRKQETYRKIQKAETYCLYEGEEKPLEILMEGEMPKEGKTVLTVFGNPLTIDWEKCEVSFPDRKITFCRQEQFSIRIYADVEVLEVFVLNGSYYLLNENKARTLKGDVKIETDSPDVWNVYIYELESVKKIPCI